MEILRLTMQDPSFWIGFVTVAIFALGRFNERLIDDEELDPPLAARCFTSRFRYAISALVYSVVYLFGYGLLILFGSIPRFQPFLMSLFGQVDQTVKFGSPAWASMIVTVLAPTLPWLGNADLQLRLGLQDFSSIPLKARRLADEIIEVALRRGGIDEQIGDDPVTDAMLYGVYDRLKVLKAGVMRSASPRRAYRFREFFARNEPIVEGIQQKITLLRASDLSGSPESVDGGPAQRAQLEGSIKRYARLLVAALLQVEGDESEVREAIRRVDGFEKFAPSEFRFTSNQIIIGGFIVIVSCTLFGPLAVILFDNFIGSREYDAPTFYNVFEQWMVKSFVIAFACVLPLSLASAVNLWRLDAIGVERRERETDVVVWIFAFVVCLLLGALPFIVAAVLSAGPGGAINLSFAFWGFVPAAVAVTFLILSSTRIRWNLMVGFIIFGLVGGSVSYFVVLFQTLAAVADAAELAPNSKLLTVRELATGGEVLKIATVGLIVSAIFGATQLGLSRARKSLGADDRVGRNDMLAEETQ